MKLLLFDVEKTKEASSTSTEAPVSPSTVAGDTADNAAGNKQTGNQDNATLPSPFDFSSMSSLLNVLPLLIFTFCFHTLFLCY
jgi:hypothetical protein